jgi:hypothetical protein
MPDQPALVRRSSTFRHATRILHATRSGLTRRAVCITLNFRSRFRP